MISIIIPLWNRYRHYSECIRSLSRERLDCEIVVVDHGSVDGDIRLPLQMSGAQWKIVTLDAPFIRARALNEGARAATGDTFFFLDADMTVPAGFLKMIEDKVGPHKAWFPRCIVQDADGAVSPNHPLSLHGYGNCGITDTDFRLAGCWDEHFKTWGKEDAAFHRAVKNAGIRIFREVLKEFVHHPHPRLKAGDVQEVPLPADQISMLESAKVIRSQISKQTGARLAEWSGPKVTPSPLEPQEIGQPPQKPMGSGKDVLLATYCPEHALYLAKTRPFWESRGFTVYEKTGGKDYAWLPRERATIIVVWNGSLPQHEGNLKYAREMCCEHLLIAEVGWFPGASKEQGGATTLCFDRKGINAQSEIVGFRPPRISVEMSDALRDWLRAHVKLAPARKAFTLVPLQLENDTNILCGSPRFRLMQDLIDFVEKTVEGRLIFRKHPRDRTAQYTVRNRKSEVVEGGDLYTQIAEAKQVIGINSTVLIESLLFGKKVAAFGHGLFDGHNVILDCTEDADEVYRIKKQFGRDREHAERVADFLHELIFRRQIVFAHLDETMGRNRVVQEVLAQCG